MSKNFSKIFFTERGAKKFTALLRQDGIVATIWTAKDAFGQTVYIVEWNA